MIHVPAATNETVVPDRVHTDAAEAGIDNSTGREEVAVATTTYTGPATMALVGTVELKEILCCVNPTPNDCCT
jgi:hypothetical protein